MCYINLYRTEDNRNQSVLEKSFTASTISQVLNKYYNLPDEKLQQLYHILPSLVNLFAEMKGFKVMEGARLNTRSNTRVSQQAFLDQVTSIIRSPLVQQLSKVLYDNSSKRQKL